MSASAALSRTVEPAGASDTRVPAGDPRGGSAGRPQGRAARSLALIALGAAVLLLMAGCAAAPVDGQSPRLNVTIDSPTGSVGLGVDGSRNPQDISVAIQIAAVLTALSLAPAVLIMVTSFTRIIVVLAFIRQALGIPQMPPNQVLIGLALFLSLFVMMPTLDTMNQEALQPYMRGQITQQQALDSGVKPIRSFMLKQTREKDLSLFVELSHQERPRNADDIQTHVLMPAFVISELRTAFQMGFVIFIPFLVIDMVVSGALMSMGMMMLPPAMVSLPFKVLLFVMVDGWYLLVGSLVKSFS